MFLPLMGLINPKQNLHMGVRNLCHKFEPFNHKLQTCYMY
jgi:hypothetical protein